MGPDLNVVDTSLTWYVTETVASVVSLARTDATKSLEVPAHGRTLAGKPGNAASSTAWNLVPKAANFWSSALSSTFCGASGKAPGPGSAFGAIRARTVRPVSSINGTAPAKT